MSYKYEPYYCPLIDGDIIDCFTLPKPPFLNPQLRGLIINSDKNVIEFYRDKEEAFCKNCSIGSRIRKTRSFVNLKKEG